MEKTTTKKNLFGPKSDFLLLGAGSVLVILFVELLVRNTPTHYEWALFITLVASFFINNPHFAQSYMIFYSDFAGKISASNPSKSLRLRYIIFGILAPLVILSYYAYFMITQDVMLLVYAVQAMFFFVGWHYVKQGYGMIILDSVLKKAFFTTTEKKILLLNAYICWLLPYIGIQSSISDAALAALGQQEMYGLDYKIQILPFNSQFGIYSFYAVITSTLITIYILAEKFRKNDGTFPWTGVIAYFTPVYVWLLGGMIGLSAISYLVIPAFHSLQYSTVVSRYVINKHQNLITDNQTRRFLFMPMQKSHIHYIQFYTLSAALGFVGFWLLSYFVDFSSLLSSRFAGIEVVVIMCLVFINIHHYFLDSVMWRKENNSVKQYLFQN